MTKDVHVHCNINVSHGELLIHKICMGSKVSCMGGQRSSFDGGGNEAIIIVY